MTKPSASYPRYELLESEKQPVVLPGGFDAWPDSGEPDIPLSSNDETLVVPYPRNYRKPAISPSENSQEYIDYFLFTKQDFGKTEGKVTSEYGSMSDHLKRKNTSKT